MIITRTPFRISFFGGGTDYPDWVQEHGGAVLATTIDKYSYITCRRLPPFFQHKHRVVYSQIEEVQSIEEINHPAVKAALSWAKVTYGLEVHHDGDLPARSGLGSSSSFTTGLVKALYGMKGQLVSKENLAKDAIHIEQDLIGESVGYQDQISAAYGGFNLIEFNKDKSFIVTPMILPTEKIENLNAHLMLFFTGFSRIANEIAKSKVANFKKREVELLRMRDMVHESIDILSSHNISIDEFGKLLHASWQLKRTLSEKVSNSEIDKIYGAALQAGALGGKILGAGGGGFMLIFAKPDRHKSIREKLRHLVHVDFKFDNSGSRIVFYHPNDQY